MTDINVGDYIQFATIVKPEVKGHHKGAGGKKYEYVIDPACWISQSGSGYVLKVNKTAKKIASSPRSTSMVKHHVARVDAGPRLGTVTVSIDDAVLVGVQQTLSIDEAAAPDRGMYDTQGVGA